MATGGRADRGRRFRDRYRNIYLSQGVKPASVRWYVLRAEQFIRAFPGRRLAELESDEISNHLAATGRKPTLMPWQFRQTVDAIQSLYSPVNTEWAAGPDRDFWRDSARTVGAQHATTRIYTRVLNRGGLGVRSPLDAR
jgi:hypothetical protein